MGIFDVENNRLGLSENTRALEGSFMSCSGDSCDTVGDTEVKHDPKTGNIPNSLLYVIITSVLVGIAVCIAIAVCKMKKSQRVP